MSGIAEKTSFVFNLSRVVRLREDSGMALVGVSAMSDSDPSAEVVIGDRYLGFNAKLSFLDWYVLKQPHLSNWDTLCGYFQYSLQTAYPATAQAYYFEHDAYLEIEVPKSGYMHTTVRALLTHEQYVSVYGEPPSDDFKYGGGAFLLEGTPDLYFGDIAPYQGL